MSTSRRSVTVAIFVLLALALPVHAQSNKQGRVNELIGLLQEQPDGMSTQDWKEKRREAARELGQLGDTSAVPSLIKIVETEEFDVVGEFAIVSLGKLRDPRAVTPLQRVAGDPTRDRDQRSAARKALKRLGASSKPSASGDTKPKDEFSTTSGLSTDTSLVAGDSSNAKAPKGPQFDDETLAAGEILRFAVGSLSMQYDSIRERPTMNGDVAGSYERRVDKKRVAWRYGGNASAAFGFVNYPGEDSSSRFGTFSALVNGEARSYLEGASVYAGALGALGTAATALRIYAPSGMNSYELVTNAEIEAGIVAGYGRVLDVGEALRLRRIEKVLRETKTLGRPITPDLAERVLAAWWALRRELGAHDRLVVTVTLLREAGVLLGEPNASTSYKILQVLLDGQLTHRLRGFDSSLGIVESYLMRDDVLAADDGRSETAIGRARYGFQNSTADAEIVGEAFARYRVFAGDEPAPWAAGAKAGLHRFFYGPNFDPIGVLELGAELGAANDDINDSNTGVRIAGTAGWRWTFNRASNLRVSGEVALESGELFMGVIFDGSHGFLDAGYVGAASVPVALK